MANNRNDILQLNPISSVIYVSSSEIIELSFDSITSSCVGQKAFGLSCLPKFWTLPFIVISDELMLQWSGSVPENKDKIIDCWAGKIIDATHSVGFELNDKIIVRSSGQNEGIHDRGKYYSKKGFLNDVKNPLKFCLERLSSDQNLSGCKIPIIVQKCASPISALGHLSNERRLSEEPRDWLGVYEEPSIWAGNHFKINNRKWREKINTGKMELGELKCNLSAHISEILKYPATWGSDRKARLHFEWVWDGKTIYVVQADCENESVGVEPPKISDLKRLLPQKFTPLFLKKINSEHGKQFEKIRNVILYKKLGLMTNNLYIIDEQKVITDIAQGNLPQQLKNDLGILVKGSLVIRMDVATNDLKKRQLLPRTNEVRKLEDAIEWLIKVSSDILKEGISEEIVFIFHNFIPSVSSAFTYAAPGKRQVQIESLWGLPEGLYYNAHDKFVVDTKKADFKDIKLDELHNFVLKEGTNYKKYFISPDSDGTWRTKTVKPPYDWRRSIKYKKWLNKLAYQSRRIAEEEGKTLSIMWFIGVPKEIGKDSIIPWYHELYDPVITRRAITHRTKTPFDKSLIIKNNDDVEKLRAEVLSGTTLVRRVRIQPNDEKLLRNKETLRTLGQLAKKADAIILLEGGVLSHAYYQLMETKAIVEVKHPFPDFVDKREFNKLVRDKIPTNIESGGEVVNKARLSGEYFLRALKEKLIEEAFEVLDSIDQKAIIEELADVNELIDGILSQLKVSREELRHIQDIKRTKSGGFETGSVLLKTKNPLPTKVEVNNPLFNNFKQAGKLDASLSDALMAINNYRSIQKWSDRRRHPSAEETVFKLTIPMTVDNWVETSPLIKSDSEQDGTFRAKITGGRKGSKIQIEISFYIPNKQLKLF